MQETTRRQLYSERVEEARRRRQEEQDRQEAERRWQEALAWAARIEDDDE